MSYNSTPDRAFIAQFDKADGYDYRAFHDALVVRNGGKPLPKKALQAWALALVAYINGTRDVAGRQTEVARATALRAEVLNARQ